MHYFQGSREQRPPPGGGGGGGAHPWRPICNWDVKHRSMPCADPGIFVRVCVCGGGGVQARPPKTTLSSTYFTVLQCQRKL